MAATTELLSRAWLFVTIPGFVIGTGLIVAGVVLLLRTIRVPALARLPLVAEQEFDLTAGGPLVFALEKPRFQRVQANALNPVGLSVTMENAAGRADQAHPVLMPVVVEGLRSTRVDIANLAASQAGRYRLHLAGLASDFDMSESFIVISRPVSRPTLALGILLIIAGAALALGSLIASIATVVHFQRG